MKISAVILAGGESRRMGRDKAEIVFKDKRTIDIMAEKLRCFDEIFISADKTYEADGCKNISDIYKGKGPASGILSALKEMKADALFVTACDMPLIKEETVHNMCVEYLKNGSNFDAAVLKTNDRINPLFAVYGKNTAEIFEEAILCGELSVKKIIDKMKVYSVDYEKITDNDKEFLNMNTADDCKIVEKVYYENGFK